MHNRRGRVADGERHRRKQQTKEMGEKELRVDIEHRRRAHRKELIGQLVFWLGFMWWGSLEKFSTPSREKLDRGGAAVKTSVLGV